MKRVRSVRLRAAATAGLVVVLVASFAAISAAAGRHDPQLCGQEVEGGQDLEGRRAMPEWVPRGRLERGGRHGCRGRDRRDWGNRPRRRDRRDRRHRRDRTGRGRHRRHRRHGRHRRDGGIRLGRPRWPHRRDRRHRRDGGIRLGRRRRPHRRHGPERSGRPDRRDRGTRLGRPRRRHRANGPHRSRHRRRDDRPGNRGRSEQHDSEDRHGDVPRRDEVLGGGYTVGGARWTKSTSSTATRRARRSGPSRECDTGTGGAPTWSLRAYVVCA